MGFARKDLLTFPLAVIIVICMVFTALWQAANYNKMKSELSQKAWQCLIWVLILTCHERHYESIKLPGPLSLHIK